mmetsp:Transcript_36806/g.37091  ORF Transcript_36806/g.37091 Transcript_36806/m.37091 type:complete len:355 (+) Transcript_36806:252-1316(+)
MVSFPLLGRSHSGTKEIRHTTSPLPTPTHRIGRIKIPAIKPSSQNGNTHGPLLHIIIGIRPEQNIGILIDRLVNNRRGTVRIVNTHILAPHDIHHHPRRPFDRHIDQRGGNRGYRRIFRHGFAGTGSDPDKGGSGIAHDAPYIGEIDIHHPRPHNDLTDSDDSLSQDIVRHRKATAQRCSFRNDLEEFVVRNDNDGIGRIVQSIDRRGRLIHSPPSLEAKRFGNDRHRQRAALFGDLCHHRSSPTPGTATHTTRHKNHIGPTNHGGDIGLALLRRQSPNLRISPGAQSSCHVDPNVENVGTPCFRASQSLRVRVDRPVFHAEHFCFHHAVNGVASSSADPDYFDYAGGESPLGH